MGFWGLGEALGDDGEDVFGVAEDEDGAAVGGGFGPEAL